MMLLEKWTEKTIKLVDFQKHYMFASSKTSKMKVNEMVKSNRNTVNNYEGVIKSLGRQQKIGTVELPEPQYPFQLGLI